MYWYNHLHQHSSIHFVSPHVRHQGLDQAVLERRAAVYERAKRENPHRWSGKTRDWKRVVQVYLNKKHTTKEAA